MITWIPNTFVLLPSLLGNLLSNDTLGQNFDQLLCSIFPSQAHQSDNVFLCTEEAAAFNNEHCCHQILQLFLHRKSTHLHRLDGFGLYIYVTCCPLRPNKLFESLHLQSSLQFLGTGRSGDVVRSVLLYCLQSLQQCSCAFVQWQQKFVQNCDGDTQLVRED